MELEQFIKKAHKEIDSFEEWYLKERKKSEDAERWPLKMSEVDWHEQLIMYFGFSEG